MTIILIIICIICGIAIGMSIANIIRLKKVEKCLKELDPKDPEFEVKMSIIKKFNYLWS